MMPDILLKDALQIYRDKVSILKKGYQQERYRLDQLCRSSLGEMIVSQITSVDIATYRDQRLAQVNPKTGKPLSTSTVRLELCLLSNFFDIGRIEWGFCDSNPVANVRKPKSAPGRERRITAREERQILRYCHTRGNTQLATIFVLALESAMRQGELLGMMWEHVDLRSRIVHLPETKNGQKRDVPLSVKAREALIRWGVHPSGKVFRYSSAAGLKSSWKYMINALGIEDLHFHDTRHEAASRLSELGSLDSIEIAAITGHKSMQMLKRYSHLKANKLVRKLDAPRNKAHRAVLDQIVPYPAQVMKIAQGTRVKILDFDNIEVVAKDDQMAVQMAQDALLRNLLLCIRDGKPLPTPDQYLDSVPEEQVLMIDPLAHQEAS